MKTPQVVESIRKHLTINELNEKGQLKYDYVVKEYYPKVRYWLDSKGLPLTDDSIKNNKVELSAFINKYTLSQLREMEENDTIEEDVEEEVAPKKKKDNGKVIIILIIVSFLVYLAVKSDN